MAVPPHQPGWTLQHWNRSWSSSFRTPDSIRKSWFPGWNPRRFRPTPSTAQLAPIGVGLHMVGEHLMIWNAWRVEISCSSESWQVLDIFFKRLICNSCSSMIHVHRSGRKWKWSKYPTKQLIEISPAILAPWHLTIYIHLPVWLCRFPKVGVTPKSSILIGVSIINHRAIGVPPLKWKPPYGYSMIHM